MKNKSLIIIFSLLIIFHAVLFYFAIGPYNLFTDSAGYLSTADMALNGMGWIFNPNRPIGLPLFFFALLKVSHGYLGFITLFQVVSLIGAIIFAVHEAIPNLQSWKKVFISWIVILFSTRTFIYSYLILSESLFATALLLFLAFFLKYLRFNKRCESGICNFALWGMFFSALFAAWIKSVGMLFLLVFVVVLVAHVIYSRKFYVHSLAMLMLLFLSISINNALLGTYSFSKQDGIQWLISANEYINYKSPFMRQEKNFIYDSHQEILRRYYPRTRLDQMIGPVEGVETPAQILQKNSANYDEFNNKIRNLIFEGLKSDDNWKRYLVSGGHELEKTILGDEKEGLIIPMNIQNSNELIISWLPNLRLENQQTQLNSNRFAVKYYNIIIKFGVLPKYITPFIFLSLLVFTLYLNVRKEIIIVAASIFILFMGYLYVSVLLVFALDRYFVGVETIFFILALYLIQGIKNNKISFK